MGQFDEKLKKEFLKLKKNEGKEMTDEEMMGEDISTLDEVRIVLVVFFHVALHSFVRKMILVTLV